MRTAAATGGMLANQPLSNLPGVQMMALQRPLMKKKGVPWQRNTPLRHKRAVRQPSAVS